MSTPMLIVGFDCARARMIGAADSAAALLSKVRRDRRMKDGSP
ncbi:MAG TPA: hypothetical protein VGL95_14070 [Acetobacteraceae bacterium]